MHAHDVITAIIVSVARPAFHPVKLHNNNIMFSPLPPTLHSYPHITVPTCIYKVLEAFPWLTNTYQIVIILPFLLALNRFEVYCTEYSVLNWKLVWCLWYQLPYVTHSRKRYNFGENCVPFQRAFCALYNNPNPSFVVFSCHVLWIEVP